MTEKTLAQKLMIKEGRSVRLINPPTDYAALLGALPPTADVISDPAQQADIIQVFVRNRQELETELLALITAFKPNGMIWVTYYKGTSKHKSDIHRDSIAEYAQTLGLHSVAMLAINKDWSALRLKLA